MVLQPLRHPASPECRALAAERALAGLPAAHPAPGLACPVPAGRSACPLPCRTAVIWGLANCLRALLGAWMRRRFVGTDVRLTRRWELAGLFLFGGLVSPLVSATLGGLGYTFSSRPA